MNQTRNTSQTELFIPPLYLATRDFLFRVVTRAWRQNFCSLAQKHCFREFDHLESPVAAHIRCMCCSVMQYVAVWCSPVHRSGPLEVYQLNYLILQQKPSGFTILLKSHHLACVVPGSRRSINMEMRHVTNSTSRTRFFICAWHVFYALFVPVARECLIQFMIHSWVCCSALQCVAACYKRIAECYTCISSMCPEITHDTLVSALQWVAACCKVYCMLSCAVYILRGCSKFESVTKSLM